MSIYIAHRRKNASNALNVRSTFFTDQKETSSVYDENSQFACPAHANCFGTSSMSLVQRQRRCDGRHAMSVCLFVCPSTRHVRRFCQNEKHIFIFYGLHSSYFVPNGMAIFWREPLNGASNAGGVAHNRDSGRIANYRSMTAAVRDQQLKVVGAVVYNS